MSSIFISHSSQDNSAAESMKDWLQGQGYQSLFLDFDPSLGIDAGSKWEDVLFRKLRQCQALIVLLTPNWLQSKWCFAELVQAKEQGKAIFVVKIQACDDSQVSSELQHVDLTVDGDGYDRLAKGLRQKGLDPINTFSLEEGRSPYPGLQSFEEKDAAIFFGRDAEMFEGLEVLNKCRIKGTDESRFVLFLGASGSGKSSLVKAGVLPRLGKDSDHWLIVRPFSPRRDPLEELAIVLAESFQSFAQPQDWKEILKTLQEAAKANAPKGRGLLDWIRDLKLAAGQPEATVLLVIDQAEELFGAGVSDAAGHFLRWLRAMLGEADQHLMVLATMRSDFLGEFQLHRELEGFKYSTVTVAPMLSENFPQIIEKPAALVGVRLEEGLVQMLLHDLTSRDALPLLAYTLRRLYEGFSDDRKLEIREYQALGRLEASVQQAADQVIEDAKPVKEELEELRSAFIPNMVRIGEDRQYVRRLAYCEQLPQRAEALLNQFVEARLLVKDRDQKGRETLEITHEALLRSWPMLMDWLKEDEYKLRVAEGIRRAAQDWNEGKQAQGYLVHREGRLRDARDLIQEKRFALVEHSIEKEYLNACTKVEDEEERAQRRRRRNIIIGLSSGLLLTTSGFVGAAVQFQRGELKRMVQYQVTAQLLTQTNPREGLMNGLAAVGLGRSNFLKFPNLSQSELVSEGILLAPSNKVLSKVLRGHQFSVWSVAFSLDGQSIVSGSGDGTIRLWDLEGKPIGLPFQGDHQSNVWSVAFSPDGQSIVSGSEDGTIRLWDLEGKPISASFKGHQSSIRSVAFSPDGQSIVSGSENGTIRLWDLEGKPISASFKGHQSNVWSVAFSPDGQSIVSGSSDRTVRLWDLEGKPIGLPFEGHQDWVWSVAFSPNGQSIVSGSADRTVRLWDLEGKPIGVPFQGDQSNVWSVAFSPDGQSIVSGCHDGTVRLWDLESKPIGFPFQYDQARVWSVAFSPDGQSIVSGSADGTVRLWDLEGKPIGSPFQEHHARVWSVAFSPDGQSIVSGSEDGTVRLWDLEGKPIGSPFQGHQSNVFSVAFNPDGQSIVSSSSDGTVRLWDLEGNSIGSPFKSKPIGSPSQGTQDWVRSVAFSFDGQSIVSGRDDGTIRLWDLDGKPIGSPFQDDQARRVRSVTFSPDGQSIVSGSEDGMVRLWDLEGKLIGPPFQGHQFSVSSIAFSPDGQSIVSGSEDGTVRLWDLEGKPIGKPFHGHQSGVSSVAFSPDGQSIVSGSYDNTLRLWSRLPWPGWLEVACDQISRSDKESEAAKEANRTCQRYVWSKQK